MTALSRRALFSLFAAALGLSLGMLAPARASDDVDLIQPINQLHAALAAAMRAGRAESFSDRFNALAPVIERVFDLETVLKVSVGMRWASFDDRARERLKTAFRRFTVATYVANYDRYDGERFSVMPDARRSGNDRIVQTEVISDPAGPVRLDYVMRAFGSTWRAVDVLVDGSISRVAVQRSDFRMILANGDVEALIKSLNRKVVDLSDGALSA